MSNEPIDGRIFRALLSACLQIEVNSIEAAEIAHILRKGDISDRLANVFDGLAGANTLLPSDNNPEMKKPAGIRAREKIDNHLHKGTTASLLDDVKRRKINKSTLLSLLDRVNDQVSSKIQDDLSMREAIEQFRKGSSTDDWLLLSDLVNGRSELDPYLARMISR